MSETSITCQEAERFLVEEAALLDEWRLNDWFKLVDEGGRYLVPALDTPNADYRDTLFLVSDDYVTLKSRVAQLLGRSTWSENPRSRTRRLVTNVRVLETTGEEALVTANFAVWRFQLDSTDVYVGKYMHRLLRTPDGLRFKERRTVLDLETLRPHGKLSFIL
jgi:p-cumate 2,3-dioxygenase subunit beta